VSEIKIEVKGEATITITPAADTVNVAPEIRFDGSQIDVDQLDAVLEEAIQKTNSKPKKAFLIALKEHIAGLYPSS